MPYSRRTGKRMSKADAERFWSRVEDTGDCWLWLAGKTKGGYGMIRIDGKNSYAHRVIYENAVGPIPHGRQIDHLCRVRHCVNPAHLEVVTPQENWRRGESVTVAHSRKTHCPRGHPYDAENTLWKVRKGRVGRDCRCCDRARSARRREARAHQ